MKDKFNLKHKGKFIKKTNYFVITNEEIDTLNFIKNIIKQRESLKKITIIFSDREIII